MTQFPSPRPAAADDERCAKNNNSDYDVMETKPVYGRRADLAQLMATLVQSLLLVNVGMELAMATIVIGSLYNRSDAEFSLTDSESSWYGSILYVCQPIGSWMSGYAQKRYGKKSCVVLACVPSIVGWTMLWSAKSVGMLYMSTLTMGVGLGFNDGPAYSYIGEICEPRLRGIMSCVVNMACLIGVMSSFGLGFVFHWKTVAALNATCPILCLLLVAFIPESPIWLISRGQNEKAMNAVCWLRGWVKPSVVAAEYNALVFYYKVSVEKARSVDKSDGVFSSIAWLKNPSVYRPLRLVSVYYMFTLISCLTPCRPYIVQIMYEAGVRDTHSISLVLFGLMQLCGSIVLTVVVRKLGKRTLTISTLVVNIVTIFVFGVYIELINRGLVTAVNYVYVPMVLYSVVMFSGAMGMLTIPWTLVSEIYPNEAKGFASSLTTAILYMLTFAATKVYLGIQTTLGLSNTFFASSAISLVGLAYLYRNMPETENKTLLEIEEWFAPKTKHGVSESQSESQP